MATNDQPYRRLPGTGYRYAIPGWAMVLLFFVIGIFVLLFRGRRVQLWRGGEHLLVVEWDGYREYYKRFDYRDVQAILLRKTNEGAILNAIMWGLLCLFALFALLAQEMGLRIFLLVVAGAFGLIGLLNVLGGPTCRCSIRTAVQTDELPSLNRLRRARKVLGQLRPLITAAQGQLSPEEIAARMSEVEPAPVPSAANVPAPQAYIIDDPNAPPRIL